MKIGGRIGMAVAIILIAVSFSQAQGNQPSPSGSTPAPSGGNTPASPSGGGGGGGTFSIETDLFAYKSLQADSEAITCDIVGYLFTAQAAATLPPGPNDKSDSDPTGFTRVTTGCNLNALPSPSKGVVIVSSTSTTLANFQLWRVNMLLMRQLLLQAGTVGLPSLPGPPKGALPADLSGSLSIASQAVTLLQGVLGLFASNQSYAGIAGSIQDQALINDVGRQLRNLHIPVLLPDTYTPHAFGGIDPATSPFLKDLASLITEHARLQKILQVDQAIVNLALKLQADRLTVAADQEKLKQPDLTAAQKQPIQDEILKTNAEIASLGQQLTGVDVSGIQQTLITCQSVVSAMESFLTNLTGGSFLLTTQVVAAPSQSTGTPPPAQTPAANTPSATAGGGGTPPIIAILSADGLAQAIGASGPTLEPSPGWHFLWLKALESGGGITTESNIFGSKAHFSGGAVASYDLFQFNGNLSCSGNVMAYGGYVKPKDFGKKFLSSNVDPRKQLIYLRGGCSTE